MGTQIGIYLFKQIRAMPEFSRNNTVTSLSPNESFKDGPAG